MHFLLLLFICVLLFSEKSPPHFIRNQLLSVVRFVIPSFFTLLSPLENKAQCLSLFPHSKEKERRTEWMEGRGGGGNKGDKKTTPTRYELLLLKIRRRRRRKKETERPSDGFTYSPTYSLHSHTPTDFCYSSSSLLLLSHRPTSRATLQSCIMFAERGEKWVINNTYCTVHTRKQVYVCVYYSSPMFQGITAVRYYSLPGKQQRTSVCVCFFIVSYLLLSLHCGSTSAAAAAAWGCWVWVRAWCRVKRSLRALPVILN